MAYFSNQGTPIHSGAAGLGAQLAPDGGTYCLAKDVSCFEDIQSKDTAETQAQFGYYPKRGSGPCPTGRRIRPQDVNKFNPEHIKDLPVCSTKDVTTACYNPELYSECMDWLVEYYKLDAGNWAHDEERLRVVADRWCQREFCLTGRKKAFPPWMDMTPEEYRKSVQGLGQDQGALMSYRDGSLGQDQGALMSYRDGSLGQDQGALMSYRDGSLGQDQGALMSYRDGSLGQDQGALMAFRDGTLGGPLFIDGRRIDTPVNISHTPVKQSVSGCRSCGGLGQTGAVLNMKDPEVVRQVKGLMALIAGPTVNDSFPPEMFESGIWGKKSTDYAGAWIVAVGSAIPFDPNKMFTTHEQGMYPTATGIVAMMQMASEAGVLSEEEAQKTVPDIVQFISETQGDPTKGTVEPPRRTEGMKPTTMALIGVGAVAAVGGMWMMGRRRRR